VAILSLLAACDTTPDSELAYSACSGIGTTYTREACMANYVGQLQAGRNAQWEAIGAGMASGGYYRRQTTCMNIGGIVTCQ
jgi:hypothetical protein